MNHATENTSLGEGKGKRKRPIRSFVLRGGRLTEGQKRAIDKYWPQFGIDEEGEPIDLADLF